MDATLQKALMTFEAPDSGGVPAPTPNSMPQRRNR